MKTLAERIQQVADSVTAGCTQSEVVADVEALRAAEQLQRAESN